MTQVGVIDFCDFAMNGQDAIEKIKREVQDQIRDLFYRSDASK